MKTTIKLLTVVLLVTISSCNNTKTIDYKYEESPKLLTCNLSNEALYKEAVYAFENDIINTYDAKNKNVSKAYSNFINFKLRGNFKVTDVASEHTLKIANALKKEPNLWVTTNGVTALNKSHSLVNCIADNIKNKDIKATYNALLTTSSLKPNLILPLLSSNARFIQTDGDLKTYIALEMFYTQLLEVKLEELKNPNPQPLPEPVKPAVKGVDFNKTTAK